MEHRTYQQHAYHFISLLRAFRVVSEKAGKNVNMQYEIRDDRSVLGAWMFWLALDSLLFLLWFDHFTVLEIKWCNFLLSFCDTFLLFSLLFLFRVRLNIVLGCSHNNSRFANGSHVPTAEPCLSCKCINANLICALRVCPEQVFPPPRGCVIVQKKNACCPYMTCSKLHVSSLYNQDKKVITHDRKWYEQNIRNRIFNQNQLQRRIEDDDPTSDGQQQLSNGRSKYPRSVRSVLSR